MFRLNNLSWSLHRGTIWS